MKTRFFLIVFCFNISEKTRYFNIGFVSLRYKNINQYYTNLIEKYTKNHIFFQKIFGILEFVFFFLSRTRPNAFWSGPVLFGPMNSGATLYCSRRTMERLGNEEEEKEDEEKKRKGRRANLRLLAVLPVVVETIRRWFQVAVK